jgi:hypothetical protein
MRSRWTSTRCSPARTRAATRADTHPIKAAGDNAGSASGLGGILLAEAPLKQVPGLQHKRSAELKQTDVTVRAKLSQLGCRGRRMSCRHQEIKAWPVGSSWISP